MRLGVRGKFFFVSSALVLFATSVIFFYARRDIEERTIVETQLDLSTRATLMSGWATQLMSSSSYHDELDIAALQRFWQPQAKSMARLGNCRVTILRKDGFVLGDSKVSDGELPKMENHAQRPEFREALARGVGSSRRFSSTISRDFMYTAAAFPQQGPTYGVMRASVELSQIATSVAALRRSLTISAVIALLIALGMSMVTAQISSRAARSLTQVARKMASGELDVHVPTSGTDEMGELGRALDLLTRNLQQSLRALKTERDRMDGVLSRMHEGVLMVDATGHITLVNPALREMLLLQDAVGKSPLEVVRHSELKLLFDEVVHGGTAASKEIDVAGLMPRKLLVRVAPLGAEQGGAFAVFFDVTEMRRLETLRRDFIANVSHELRTPVTAIRSAGDTIRDIAINDPQALPRFIDIIVRNAERLGSLLDDILELSRIESRALRLVLEPVEVGSLLTQVAGLFRERAERKGLQLQVAAEPAPIYVQADRRALENVLTNLIDNSVKYSGSGAVIRISGDFAEGQVRVIVEDTGPGIDPSHLPRLFERFYRVDAGRSRELGGTGLGLSIVKHLVEAMGSQIRVESTPGVGSRFFFCLPRVGPEIELRSSPSGTLRAAGHVSKA